MSSFNYSTIIELEFDKEIVTDPDTGSVNGFVVTANEYDRITAGELVNKQYVLDKIRYAAPPTTEVVADLSVADLSNTVFITNTIQLEQEV